jgi:hypothetical protein
MLQIRLYFLFPNGVAVDWFALLVAVVAFIWLIRGRSTISLLISRGL